MRKCPECNVLNDDSSEYCVNCGYPFTGDEETIENPECDKTQDDEELDNHDIVEKSATEKNVNSDENGDVNSDAQAEKNEENPDIQENDSPINQDSTKTIKGNFNKRTIGEVIGGVVLIIALIVAITKSGQVSSLQKQYNEVSQELKAANEQIASLTDDNAELTQANDELTSKNDELENGAAKQLVDIRNAYESGDWETVINLASTLHEQYNGSQEDIEAQKLAAESQAKIDEANAAKAAEEAKGYETGITYDQLARTPDDYYGKKVKFSGKVVQVIEGSGDDVQIRLAVNDDYDTILFGQYSSDIVSSRVLEDDYITIYGMSVGTISYESTMGGTITIPGVYIDKIEQ